MSIYPPSVECNYRWARNFESRRNHFAWFSRCTFVLSASLCYVFMLLHTYLFLFHLQLCIVSSGSYIANRHRNWSGALAKSNLIFWLRSAGGERKIRSSRRRCYWFCWCNLRLVFPLGSSQSDRTNTHLRKQFWPGVFQLPLQLRCFVSLVTRNTVVRCFFGESTIIW